MDFAYTDEQRAFRAEFRAWLEDNLPDGWLEGDHDLPEDDAEREAFLREWQRTLHEGGWSGIAWPAEYGGRDATLTKQVVYNQELARVNAPLMINRVGILFVGPTLMEIGTDDQRERFVPKMLDAEHVWCQGFSEPDAGSDLANLQTRAEAEGDRFVINGGKVWVSYAHFADWCFLLARTSDDSKHGGITALLVPMDQAGVTVEPIRQMPGTSDFNQVFFDDAVTPSENVVGEVGGGWSAAMTLLSFEHGMSRLYEPDRLSLERRWEELVEFCQHHPEEGEPLSEDPEVRRKLAEFDTRIQAAKVTHLRYVQEHEASGQAGPKGSMDRVFSSELYQEMEDFAMGLLGPRAGLDAAGFEGGRWPRRYLESFGATISGGTSDINRNIIAERVLGLPKDLPE